MNSRFFFLILFPFLLRKTDGISRENKIPHLRIRPAHFLRPVFFFFPRSFHLYNINVMYTRVAELRAPYTLRNTIPTAARSRKLNYLIFTPTSRARLSRSIHKCACTGNFFFLTSRSWITYANIITDDV